MGGTKTNAAPRGDDALPDLSGEDEIQSEATKVGDGRIALEEAGRASLGAVVSPEAPDERATSKMAPFQLEQVLERLAETPPEQSQARMKAPSQRPPAAGDASIDATRPSVFERSTVPGAAPVPATHRADPQSGSGIASVLTTFVAVLFIALVCAVLLAR